MAEIEIVVYIVVFLLSLFFTMISLAQKNMITSFLAMITWFAMAGFNLAFLYESILLNVSYLYFALGMVFLIYGFTLVVMNLRGQQSKDLTLS